MRLNRLRIILEPFLTYDDTNVLRVTVDIADTANNLNYEVVIPHDDFATTFDYVWNKAKHELDKFIDDNRELAADCTCYEE